MALFNFGKKKILPAVVEVTVMLKVWQKQNQPKKRGQV